MLVVGRHRAGENAAAQKVFDFGTVQLSDLAVSCVSKWARTTVAKGFLEEEIEGLFPGTVKVGHGPATARKNERQATFA